LTSPFHKIENAFVHKMRFEICRFAVLGQPNISVVRTGLTVVVALIISIGRHGDVLFIGPRDSRA
jgi:hypothetical protein